MRVLAAAFGLALVFALLFGFQVGTASAQTPGREVYDRALSRLAASPLGERVTGVVVPHHAPALDLAAWAFALAGGREVERLVILSPDHFRQSRTPFATTDKSFQTPYGPVRADRAAVEDLARSPLVSRSDLFDNEHGVAALLPLAAVFFPKAALVPVAARITATRQECEQLADLLAQLMTPGTLVVLSADFSHHLPRDAALRMDQQSLNALAGGDPEAMLALRQPNNVDTLAMLYVQALLQKRLGAPFTALANTDASEALGRPVPGATSYLAGIWGPKGPVPAQGQRVVFAGDTFFGRFLAGPLADPARRAELARRVKELTGGADLVVNLEGVLAETCPPPSHDRQLCMEAAPALAMFGDMNVKWVGLANNHAMDLGSEAHGRMKRLLTDAGFTVLEKNTVTEVGALEVAAFTALENGKSRAETAIRAPELAVLDRAGRADGKPLAVFVHWGQEWAASPDAEQMHLYDAFRAKGAGLVIGAHSHRPGIFECGDGNCLASSLGNFVFDQNRPEAGGTILEVTVFPRGTWYARPIPVGNLGGEILRGGARRP